MTTVLWAMAGVAMGARAMMGHIFTDMTRTASAP
jgi:hypothetical protein